MNDSILSCETLDMMQYSQLNLEAISSVTVSTHDVFITNNVVCTLSATCFGFKSLFKFCEENDPVSNFYMSARIYIYIYTYIYVN